MLRLSDNTNLREQLGWTHDRNLFTETICHGLAALLSADTGNRLIYQKYQIVAFPAVTNKQTPMVGYMPRPMPWCFEEKLNVFGGTHLSTQSPIRPTILIEGLSQAPVRKRQITSADWPEITAIAKMLKICR